MNEIEIRKILGIIQVAYPHSFKDMQLADRNALVALWHRQFADFDYNIVATAIDSIIATDTSGFMPSIGNVKQEIIKLTQLPMLTEHEAWDIVKKAIDGASVSPDSVLFINGQTDGKTSAQRNFEKLPPEIQRIVGGSKQLAEWAVMEPATISSVVASNFMRSYRARVKHEREYLALPNDIRVLIGNITSKEVNLIG